ncbi:MAG: cobalamin-dependent protein [Candidatus Omnitrophota bacterium]|nr:MAG: cobalamin-dependent protein [Candidatus Omnitrophota bacterium]
MRVLLISPPNVEPIRAGIPLEIDEEIGAIPSLGLMYLAQAVHDQKKHEVSILDTRIEDLSYEEYTDRIVTFKPDLVGITTMSFTLNNVINTVQFINKKLPKTLICLGGPHLKNYSEETLKLKNIRVDYIVKGEGEKTFPQLLDRIETGESLEDIEGIGYKKDGKIFINPTTSLIDSLDSIRWPDRRLVPYKLCYSILGNGEIMTTIQTSRGCPYNCIYCHEARSKYRRRNVYDVIDEIEHCVSLGIKDFFFIDDLFTLNKQWILTFCRLLIEKGLKIKFKISARVNTIDGEILQWLNKAGCYRIHYGIESASQRVLDVLQKKITLRQQKEAVFLTKKAGIRTFCYFILGSPSETKEEILKTIDYAIELDSDYAHFAIAVPYPGTQLYKDGIKEGIFSCDFWREFAENPHRDFKPQLWLSLPKNELAGLQTYANKRFYNRPKVFLRELLNTNSMQQLCRKIRVALKLLFPGRHDRRHGSLEKQKI